MVWHVIAFHCFMHFDCSLFMHLIMLKFLMCCLYLGWTEGKWIFRINIIWNVFGINDGFWNMSLEFTILSWLWNVSRFCGLLLYFFWLVFSLYQWLALLILVDLTWWNGVNYFICAFFKNRRFILKKEKSSDKIFLLNSFIFHNLLQCMLNKLL